MPSIGKRHNNFILEVFGLLRSIKGRVNFLSLARYGKCEERHYRSRFQIEFNFRDAKQHARREHCQARSSKKLHFHWNAFLIAINLAKAVHWLPLTKQERGTCSMADIKTRYNNQLMTQRLLDVFGIKPNKRKNKEKIWQIVPYEARAA